MDWRTAFADKLTAADAAARRVKSGDLVRFPMGPVPVTLMNALAERRGELQGVRVIQGATRHPHPWAKSDPAWDGHIDFVSDFISVLVRPSIESRHGDFAVTDYGIGSKVLEGGRHDGFSADVFMTPVSEPDARGFVNFGYSVWQSKALLRTAKLSIAEVGGRGLPTRGDNFVHLSEFDLLVERRDRPDMIRLPELTAERQEITEVVGAYVSTLVNDRDTIQIGTGTLSSCMGSYLTEKHDLGIDSEILVASAVELVKAGAATGRYKTYHPGVATASFVVPGADMSFCADNSGIAIKEIEWVNNLPRISSIRNLVAINQASMIDLTGQVASESIGPQMYTGPGGQLVWTMGALYSAGGRAIHVLPSTTRGGSISRIVPQLPPGTIVTVPRTFVDFVVTEYGIINLQGRTQRERALALIELAHPDFRDWLHGEARRLFWP
ncbi:MAG TPA: acetyl-CoA hydrolase/transferase C-terminal domain-containing protein [Candidatus Binatia bacterium]|nr:acetyl-CoA hydrolase/transferase C-terminal domain-containing protein [Candidatus Binatia bacterium]